MAVSRDFSFRAARSGRKFRNCPCPTPLFADAKKGIVSTGNSEGYFAVFPSTGTRGGSGRGRLVRDPETAIKIFPEKSGAGPSTQLERGHTEGLVRWQGQVLIGSWNSTRPVTLYAAD